MSLADKIDHFIELKPWLVDIFPNTVPKKADNRYFAVEAILRENQKEYDEKIKRILLKLFCYYDFEISADDGEYLTPTVEQLIHCIDACLAGAINNRDYINIFLPECDAMIILDGDDLYLSVYHPNEDLKVMLGNLAQSEGMYFYLPK